MTHVFFMTTSFNTVQVEISKLKDEVNQLQNLVRSFSWFYFVFLIFLDVTFCSI